MQHLKDLQYYRAEVHDIARLSPEEEARLLYRIRLAHQGRIPVHLGTLAKRRLAEGYQRLVIYFARVCYELYSKIERWKDK